MPRHAIDGAPCGVRTLTTRNIHLVPGRALTEAVHAGVQDVALLECRAEGPVEPVLEIELAVPLHHVGEEVAEERRVLVEQSHQLEGVLRGHQLVEADRPRRQRSPPLGRQTMVRVGARIADTLEDHPRDCIAPRPNPNIESWS